jgi:4-amino-4-deoxy-L-arabinose transferase-like glycosyltransferase
MFEIVQTKLVHYMLPVFPALAVLTARAIAREAVRYRRKRRERAPRDTMESIFLAIVAGWCAIVALITIGLLVWSVRAGSAQLIIPAIIIALLGIETARATFISWRAGKPLFSAAITGVGMMLIVGVFYGFHLPHIEPLQTSRRVAQVLREEGATRLGSVIMIDYKEPSLAFYQGGTIREEPNTALLTTTDPLTWPRWIVITHRVWNRQPATVRAQFDVINSISGWWYPHGGDAVEVMILRKRI